jgi:DNA invertase Pin-like site-specific DNA recombinase
MFGALAEFERNLIRERTQTGLAAARARGRHGGRYKAFDAEKRRLTVELDEQRLLLETISKRAAWPERERNRRGPGA